MDATQQAFIQAWNARATVDPARELRPWLCTIAQRCAINVRRRESLRTHEPIDPSRPQPELVVELDLDAASDVWRVREALDQLPEDERVIMRMQHFEGYSMTEIGDRWAYPSVR